MERRLGRRWSAGEQWRHKGPQGVNKNECSNALSEAKVRVRARTHRDTHIQYALSEAKVRCVKVYCRMCESLLSVGADGGGYTSSCTNKDVISL